MRHTQVRLVLVIIAAALLVGICAGPARAATCIWTGLGGTADWREGLNWRYGAPVAGDDLVFADGYRNAYNGFPAGTTFASVTFAAGGFVVSGNRVTLTDGITVASGTPGSPLTASWWMPITLGAAQSSFTVGSDATLTLQTGALVDTGSCALSVAGEGAVKVSDTISGAGRLTKTGSGSLSLFGSNTYDGPTSITQGEVSLATSAAIPSGAGKGGVSVAAGATLSLGSGLAYTVNDLSGAGTVHEASDGVTLTVHSLHDSTFSGSLSGLVGLKKSGPEMLTLSGAGVDPATCDVQAGTLIVNGSIPSQVTVQGGATLGGTGPVSRLEALAGGIVWPGSGALVPTVTHVATLASVENKFTVCVADAEGGPGAGYDQLEGSSIAFGRSGTTLTVKLVSVTGGQQGLCAGWDSSKSYRWHVVTAGTTFAARAQYVVDATDFKNDLDGGVFSAVPDWGWGYVDVVFTPLARFDGAPHAGAGGDAFAKGATVPVTWKTTMAPWGGSAFRLYAVQPATNTRVFLGSVSASDATSYSFPWTITQAAGPGWHVAVELWSDDAGGRLLRTADTQTFAILEASYPITVSPGANGTITPGSGPAATFSTPTYRIQAGTGYHITGVTMDGAPQGAVSSYTFAPVTDAHTIAATFAIDTFTVTPSVVGGHGTISPATPQTLPYRATPTFTFRPAAGYQVARVTVDGLPVAMNGRSSYAFPPLTASHVIAVEFAQQTYAVTALPVSSGGSVSPLGTTRVPAGGALTVQVAPAPGHKVARVTVDGRPVSLTGGAYLFTNVWAAHRLEASFTAETFAVTASVAALSADGRSHGAVGPAGTRIYASGSRPTYAFTPERGYVVFDVTVDGVQVLPTPRGSYTFAPLSGPHALVVRFAKGYVPKPQ